MAKKQMIFKTKGMNKDLSVSAFNPEFSFENRNLRFSTNDGNTMLSWVNERGTRFITLKDKYDAVTALQGYVIGVATINHKVLVFTTTNFNDSSNPRSSGDYTDYIYCLSYGSKDVPNMRCSLLFSGELNFYVKSPLETLVSYESEEIQKVYWVDNRNQPRFINVTRNYLNADPSKFDFIPKLKLQETITVSKSVGGGSFPSGVIQYAFTYYNKYGQESNIFYTSPLRYVSPIDRGAAPDEMVDNIFEIKVSHLDMNFDYLRIYSIQRTSINGTPIVKRVQDIALSGLAPKYEDPANPDPATAYYEVLYIDTGVNGDTVDPTELFYKGGNDIIAETIEQKDGTLFLGNIQKKNTNLINSLTSAGFYDTVNHKITGISLKEESNSFNIATEDNDNALYPYANQLNLINDSEECGCPCSGFKAGNTYRCGVQFQHESGRWSDVFYIEDYPMQDTFPEFRFETTEGNHYELELRRIEGTIGHDLTVALQNLGYIKARPVVVYPELNDKKVILQGVVNPTVFTDNHRGYKATPNSQIFTGEKDIYAQSSWFFRPWLNNPSSAVDFDTGLASPYDNNEYGTWTTPIRITGPQGEHGADGNDIEFIYTRNNTGTAPSTPATGQLDHSVPEGWTDNPQGVQADMMYEYVSMRYKIQDVWTAFTTPVIWSKWGEKGQDGDGYEYIYKHFSTEQTFSNDNNNPAYWSAVQSDEYYGPSGYEWSDDPVGVDSTDKFEYVSVRKKNSGTWGQFSTPVIWSRWATQGSSDGHYEFRYKNNLTQPYAPTGTGETDGWSRTPTNPTESEKYTWMSQTYVNGNDNYLYYMGYMGDGTDLHPYDDSGDDKWNIRQVEIQGAYNPINRFKVDWDTLTFNSPDIEFDPQAQIMSYKNMKWCDVGYVEFYHTLSAIDIQTETPNAGRSFLGFVNKSFKSNDSKGIIAGLFYEDGVIDDYEGLIGPGSSIHSPFSWFVYPWHRNGSLNNDINRPSGLGTQSALLKKKVISNLRVTNSYYSGSVTNYDMSEDPQVFNSEDLSILKFNSVDTNYSNIYRGNIDTVLKPDHTYPLFSALGNEEGLDASTYGIVTPFTSNAIWATALGQNAYTTGLYWYNKVGNPYYWMPGVHNVGDIYNELVEPRDFVRMKYKSSPHLTVWTPSGWSYSSQYIGGSLPIIELRRSSLVNPFGGTSIDALKENVWVPCGKPKLLGNKVNEREETITKVNFNYGDAYYQRYDCLKTYAFTQEDPNQIVEIGSFMLETYVNIDGRYDKNRCQMNNNNMSPRNFNLINPVYTQKDNFFTYRIADDDASVLEEYPNQITWSKRKESGADIDLWTNVTLASTLEMDGNKGKVTSLQRFNDQIICFQESGVSQILYNERTQISTTEGVPIEIANSGKVDGKSYINNNIGCLNKWSITSAHDGIYFIDSNEKSIYLFNGQLTNISTKGGFNSWCKQNIQVKENGWNPYNPNDFVSYYDRINADVLFISPSETLAFNEKAAAFTSFYDYIKPYFCNLEDTGIWISHRGEVWQHQTGEPCSFFGTQASYGTILIGNPEPLTDKLFTNLEFRATVDGDGTYYNSNNTFIPFLPFDTLEVWNEYQHGKTTLANRNGSTSMQHHTNDGISALKRKFRIWRCDIPRDNAPTTDDADLGVFRYNPNPLNRIRNPWAYIKLSKKINNSASKMYLEDMEANGWIIPYDQFIKEGYLTELGGDIKYVDIYNLKVKICLQASIQDATDWLVTVSGLPSTLSAADIGTIIEAHNVTGYSLVYIKIISGTAPIDPETGNRLLYTRWKTPVARTEIHDVTLTYFD